MKNQTSIFYVTTRMTPEEIRDSVDRAKCQEDIVLLIFKAHISLTASELHSYYCEYTGRHRTPLTSMRRAMTNWMNRNKLEKTLVQKLGIYGMKETVYKLI